MIDWIAKYYEEIETLPRLVTGKAGRNSAETAR